MAVGYRKTLRLRASRPQDLRFDAWLDFLAVAAERAPTVWRDLYETCWPAWREAREFAPYACDATLRAWAERWHLNTPEGEPHPAALVCARENLCLRVWREDNGQPQPRPEYIIPVTGYADVRRGDDVEPPALPVPRRLQNVRFEALWSVWRTGEAVADARGRIIQQFTDALDAHIECYMRHVEHAKYAVEAERRQWRRHLEWFVDFQLNGREVADLLADAPEADGSTLRKALGEVAKTLNLRLRPARRGRPKK